jgi:pimeloyl-ACP methyl ester carboxylesterase
VPSVLERIRVGDGDAAREIAVRHRAGKTPGVFWLGGFMSDMQGTKAQALDEWAAMNGHAATRFDYSGHGESSGSFEDGTISRWLEEAAAVFARTEGPQIVVGSSMGGWIALLLTQVRRATGADTRIAGLVLIAPAVDMTEALMWKTFTKAEKKEIETTGAYRQKSDYSDEPYLITRALIEDGRKHLFGDRLIETGCPVHIIQGMRDTDVPPAHAGRLLSHLASDDAVLTLVKDGDHRLSRPEDLLQLTKTVEAMVAEASR